MTAQDGQTLVSERDESPVPLGDHPRVADLREDRVTKAPPQWTEAPRRPSAGDFTSERMLRMKARWPFADDRPNGRQLG